MALSDDFKQAVLQNNKIRARIMMKDSFLLDTTGGAFDEMLRFATKSDSGFMDEHDGEIFKPLDEWNEEYLNAQMVAVVNNFSVDRIDLLKKMVKKLYMKKDTPTIGKENIIQNNKNYTFEPKASVSAIKIAAVIVAALGTGILFYGIVAETPIIVSIIGGLTLVAGVFLYLSNKR